MDLAARQGRARRARHRHAPRTPASSARARCNTATLLGGPEIEHYHQAVALVVAETFEQARAAAALVEVDYARGQGRVRPRGGEGRRAKPETTSGGPPDTAVGDFDGAFAAAPVELDETYTTPDQTHAMMEPHATIAAWDGDKLTVWTSNQMIAWGKRRPRQDARHPEGERAR